MWAEVPDSLHDLLAEQSLELDEFFAKFSAEEIRPILKEARQKLLTKLAELRKAGSPTISITLHKKLLAEVQNAMFAAGADLGAALDDGIDIASKLGFTFFVQQLDEAAKLAHLQNTGDLVDVLKISGNSRLRQLNDARRGLAATEAGLYTAEQVASAERILVSVFASGGTIDDAAMALMNETEGGLWMNAEWKATRLARTELMRTLNATAMASIEAAARQLNLGQQWYEFARGPTWGEDLGIAYPGPAHPLDKRVGEDSKRMHGQVIIPGSGTLFVDPGNRMRYAEAPSRPNGRETIIPIPLDNYGKGVSN